MRVRKILPQAPAMACRAKYHLNFSSCDWIWGALFSDQPLLHLVDEDMGERSDVGQTWENTYQSLETIVPNVVFSIIQSSIPNLSMIRTYRNCSKNQ